jgi:hypothetical protein
MIGAELGKENRILISATAIGRGLEPLDVKTEPRIKLMVKAKKKSSYKCIKIRYKSSNLPLLGP